MHIFIDESGSFGRGQTGATPSVVGALVVPDSSLLKVCSKFERLRAQLPKEKGEVKGRLLGESDIVQSLDVLRRSNCLFEACVIDTSLHSVDDFRTHRAGQANSLAAGLGELHHQELVQKVHSLRDHLLQMSEPQYLQAMLTFMLLSRVSETSINYYELRQPKELAAFHWIIDGKERTRETDWELWWQDVMLPWLQTHSINHPMAMMNFASYRYFQRFQSEMPEYMPAELRGEPATDLRLLLTENFRFSSAVEPGLELVDIVTNALRRALKGNVGKVVWDSIRELIVHRAEGNLGLYTVGAARTVKRADAEALAYFQHGGRLMFPHSQRRG